MLLDEVCDHLKNRTESYVAISKASGVPVGTI
jgi:hypothetical protein